MWYIFIPFPAWLFIFGVSWFLLFFSASTYSAWTRGQHTVRQERSEYQQNGVPQTSTKDPETQRPEAVAGRWESEGKLHFLRTNCCWQYRIHLKYWSIPNLSLLSLLENVFEYLCHVVQAVSATHFVFWLENIQIWVENIVSSEQIICY